MPEENGPHPSPNDEGGPRPSLGLILAHQPDENVAVADLIAAARVMALLTLRLLG